MSVSSTLAGDNGGSGVHIAPTGSANVFATLSRVEAHNNSVEGIFVDATMGTGKIYATVNDSLADYNAGGFVVSTASGQGTPSLTVARSVAANNRSLGLFSFGPNAVLRIGQSVVTGNGDSWLMLNGGTVLSYGDNDMDGNQTGDPAPGVISRK